MDRKRQGRTRLRHSKHLRRLTRAVCEPHVFLDPPVAEFMFGDDLESLTSQELAILSLLSQGYNCPAIARSLEVNIQMVKQHIGCICFKAERWNRQKLTHN